MSFELFPVVQWFDNNGNPLSGGLISTFAAGTTTPQATYTDSTGGTPQSNPVVLDAAGRAQIWFAAASYKLVLKTAAGVTLMTIDNVTLDNLAATISSLSMTGNLTLQQSTAATAIANQSSNLVKIQANYWNGVASAVDEWDVRNVLGSGTNPTSTLTFTHSGSSGTTSVDLPNLSFSNLTVTGNETIGGTLGVTGAVTATGANVLNAKTMEGVRYADQFSGADMVAKILAAMTDMASTGGDIYVPAGTYVCTTQLLIPNDGATMPLQKSFRIIGAGMGTNSAAGAASLGPNGGTILDMQFSATTGKIDTRGAGYLEISGITFKDSASDGTPFIFCTNTVLHLHDCAFFGSAAGASAVNTGIILGGTAHAFNGSTTGAFQGYGTVIRENQFHQLKTCILLQTDANNIQIVNNNIWADCGDTAGAAITLAPAASTCVGNWISGNLIEVVNYKYGIWLKVNSFNNTLIGNGTWDATATTTASVRCDSGATNNFVIEGFASDTKPGLQDGNTVRANTLLSAHTRTTGAGLGSFLNEPLTIVDSSAGPGLQVSIAGPGIPEYSLIRTDNNDQIYQQLQNLTLHDWGLWWKPLGGTAENMFVIEYLGVQQYTVAMPGTSFNSFDAPNGDLKVRSKSGNTLFLGDVSLIGIQVTNGNTTVNQKVTSYNGIATLSNGLASTVAAPALTAQTANIAATTAYAVPASGAGKYLVTVYIIVTSVGTTSTLPAASVIWTDRDNSTVQTAAVTSSLSTNTLTTVASSTINVSAKASTNIQVSTGGYASTGTPMQYAIRVEVIAL